MGLSNSTPADLRYIDSLSVSIGPNVREPQNQIASVSLQNLVSSPTKPCGDISPQTGKKEKDQKVCLFEVNIDFNRNLAAEHQI